MSAEAKALLDELMGRSRNLDPSQQPTDISWESEDVCKHFLCGFCPHELFTNTRADLGPCNKIHDDALRKEYGQHPKFERCGYEEDFVRFLQTLVTEVERRIRRGHQRLALNSQTAAANMNGGTTNQNEDKTAMLTQKINELVEQAEELGCEGKVEEAQGVMKLVDQLKEERIQLEKQPAQEDSPMIKQMEVCEVCGAFLIVGDAPQRQDEHLMGKQHAGYAQVRAEIDKRKKKVRDAIEARETTEAKLKAEREEREKERQREREERRKKENDRVRDRDRDRKKRTRSKSRDRRRSRSRDRRRSRSRDRRRNSRERRRGQRSRSRDRDRDRRRRSRSGSKGRRGSGRSSSKDPRSSQRSSRDRHRSGSRDRRDRDRESRHSFSRPDKDNGKDRTEKKLEGETNGKEPESTENGHLPTEGVVNVDPKAAVPEGTEPSEGQEQPVQQEHTATDTSVAMEIEASGDAGAHAGAADDKHIQEEFGGESSEPPAPQCEGDTKIAE